MNYTFTPPGLPINYLGAFTGTHGDPPGLSKRLRGPHGVVATPAAEIVSPAPFEQPAAPEGSSSFTLHAHPPAPDLATSGQHIFLDI